jgi:exoribonuclease II
MSLEGRIIEFLDSDSLRVGYVRKQEHDKLHLVDPRGRNLSVNGDRVVVVYRAVAETDFPALARQISERVSQRQSEVDVELLWQSLSGKEHPIQPSELAALFFSEESPEAVSAVFRALFDDTLFFKRKGMHFLPKSEEQVATERLRRQREREHEEFRDQATSLLTDLLRRKDVPIRADTKPILDRIQNWLRMKNGDEVGTILSQIAGESRARDVAYDILVRAGRIGPDVDRFVVIAGIDDRFSSAVLEAAAKLSPYTHSPFREDHREHPAFTIDDEDTKEVDDALTIFRSGKEIVVGIHIADASHFVQKGDLLDTEAARRSSTVYLPSSTVRMLPEHLSTDLVSLNSGTDRPAYTVEVRFDDTGNQLGYRIFLSTLRVARRMSYAEADFGIANNEELLQTLHTIASKLQADRASRGAITFRRPELKVRVRDGQVEVRKLDPNMPSRILVSEMMILANGLSADFAALHGIPVIFRTQEPREAVANEDIPIVEALAFERLRKTFKRSRLSLTVGAHSGLGLSAYTQASSPIRRYADLVTQRQFTAMLAGHHVPHGKEELLRIIAAAESAEVGIRQLEERSTQYWLLRYLGIEKRNEPLMAIVIDGKGSVELEDFYVRAKIAGLKLPPGAQVTVRIESVDPAKGEIQLERLD